MGDKSALPFKSTDEVADVDRAHLRFTAVRAKRAPSDAISSLPISELLLYDT
jgi:hypothetical protein